MNHDDRESTPTSSNILLSVPFKSNKDPPNTIVPTKVHIVCPDAPKKSNSTFVCAVCVKHVPIAQCSIQDSAGNNYCNNCY